jgi:hypothetical protein
MAAAHLTNLFVALLAEDSNHVLPTDDREISSALSAYGAKFLTPNSRQAKAAAKSCCPACWGQARIFHLFSLFTFPLLGLGFRV